MDGVLYVGGTPIEADCCNLGRGFIHCLYQVFDRLMDSAHAVGMNCVLAKTGKCREGYA